jgi:hypothetical protein
MVEYAVKNNPDALAMALLYEGFQIIVVSKTLVQPLVVGGLIAVAHRGKQGTDVQGVAADAPDM